MFPRNMVPPSSDLKSKPNKIPKWRKQANNCEDLKSYVVYNWLYVLVQLSIIHGKIAIFWVVPPCSSAEALFVHQPFSLYWCSFQRLYRARSFICWMKLSSGERDRERRLFSWYSLKASFTFIGFHKVVDTKSHSWEIRMESANSNVSNFKPSQ